jgi:hypothetical protein
MVESIFFSLNYICYVLLQAYFHGYKFMIFLYILFTKKVIFSTENNY